MRKLLAPALILAALFVAGCSTLTPKDIAEVQADRAALVAELPKLDAEIAKLPPDSTLRKFAEKHRAQIVATLKAGNGLMNSYAQGQITDDLRAAVSPIPYASLALTLFGLGYGFYQRRQKDSLHAATAQIVQSVDAAFPTKTEQQKLALSAVQDADTRLIVSALRDDAPEVMPEHGTDGVVTK